VRASTRAALSHRPGPSGSIGNTSTSTPPMARSDSTWSRTNDPSSGRAGVGYMLVATSTRIGRPAYLAGRPSRSFHRGVGLSLRPRLEL